MQKTKPQKKSPPQKTSKKNKPVTEEGSPPLKLTGKIQLCREGFGFLLPDRYPEDIFIPKHQLQGIWEGDRVEVEVLAKRRGKKLEGKILQTLKPASDLSIGEIVSRKEGLFVQIEEDKRTSFVPLAPKQKPKGEVGQTVKIKLVRSDKQRTAPTAKIVEVLKERGSLETETEVVWTKFHLPREFSEKTVKESEKISPEIELSDERKDLRDLPFITVDGETARDFDDAIYVKKTRSGFELSIAIADVSFYIAPKSALNEEAYKRATSVYFPNSCIPMLPEKLSNNLCSLRPDEPRLVFVAEIFFDKKGQKQKTDFYKGVIQSNARMTYNEVKKIQIDRNSALRKKHKKLLPLIENAFELFALLREGRLKRGSLDFDLPEPTFNIDPETSLSLSVEKAERHASHQLIEEFMIAANEAVAEFMAEKKVPMIYRIHGKPDTEKMTDFIQLAHHFGHTLPPIEKIQSPDLSKLLGKIKQEPYERLLNTILLRSLKQAVYSTENLGHFGLASTCYTHFTSPIRRYPDLIVHRLLEEAIRTSTTKSKGRKKSSPEEKISLLNEQALHCSQMERNAMKAEWAMRDLQVVLFMKDKVEEEYEAIISSVTNFGVFVELLPHFVEGLVPLERLPNDRYFFDEKRHELKGNRTRKRFKIGDSLRVKLVQANVLKRRLEFAWIGEWAGFREEKGE